MVSTLTDVVYYPTSSPPLLEYDIWTIDNAITYSRGVGMQNELANHVCGTHGQQHKSAHGALALLHQSPRKTPDHWHNQPSFSQNTQGN